MTIHEDTDGDGRYDSRKVFVEGLNRPTRSCREGRGLGDERALPSCFIRRRR